MRIGFGLPVSGAWAEPATIAAVARRAEDLGYDSLWTFQRLLVGTDQRTTAGDDGRFRPVVMDFGLAHEGGGDLALTRTGALLGTPAYMSPEQVLGRAIDGRADLYAMGVVLFRLLTSQLLTLASEEDPNG